MTSEVHFAEATLLFALEVHKLYFLGKVLPKVQI